MTNEYEGELSEEQYERSFGMPTYEEERAARAAIARSNRECWDAQGAVPALADNPTCYICGEPITEDEQPIPVYADSAGEQQVGSIHGAVDCSA